MNTSIRSICCSRKEHFFPGPGYKNDDPRFEQIWMRSVPLLFKKDVFSKSSKMYKNMKVLMSQIKTAREESVKMLAKDFCEKHALAKRSLKRAEIYTQKEFNVIEYTNQICITSDKTLLPPAIHFSFNNIKISFMRFFYSNPDEIEFAYFSTIQNRRNVSRFKHLGIDNQFKDFVTEISFKFPKMHFMPLIEMDFDDEHNIKSSILYSKIRYFV